MEPEVTEPISMLSADLLLVQLSDRHGGWRVELCITELNLSEQKLLLCSLCKGILREAILCEIEGRQELRCAVCLPQSDVSTQVPLHIRDVVSEKQVRCPVDACEWTGAIKQVGDHMRECALLLVPCPNGCVSQDTGDYHRVERRLLRAHLADLCPIRQVVCRFCYSGMTAVDMDAHLNDCDELCVECPNGCDEMIKRRDVSDHLSTECLLQQIACWYSQYGCEAVLERRHMELHERELCNLHSRMSEQFYSTRISEMKIIQEEQVEKIDKLERENLSIKQDLSSALSILNTPSHGKLVWRLNGVKKRIAMRVDSYSDPFYVGLYKLQARINWCNEVSGTKCTGVYIHVMQGEWDGKLHWPLMYTATVCLKNNLFRDANHIKCLEVSRDRMKMSGDLFHRPKYTRNEGFGFSNFISHADMLNRQYYHLDTLTVRVSVQVSPASSQISQFVESEFPCLRDSILNLNTQVNTFNTKNT